MAGKRSARRRTAVVNTGYKDGGQICLCPF
jgi:hypothetical protein